MSCEENNCGGSHTRGLHGLIDLFSSAIQRFVIGIFLGVTSALLRVGEATVHHVGVVTVVGISSVDQHYMPCARRSCIRRLASIWFSTQCSQQGVDKNLRSHSFPKVSGE